MICWIIDSFTITSVQNLTHENSCKESSRTTRSSTNKQNQRISSSTQKITKLCAKNGLQIFPVTVTEYSRVIVKILTVTSHPNLTISTLNAASYETTGSDTASQLWKV